MSVIAKEILKQYITCEDDATRNKFFNMLDSFWHKIEGKIIKSYTKDAGGNITGMTVLDKDNVTETVAFPVFPTSRPISFIEELSTELGKLQPKVAGKGLSTNDLTLELLNKINALENYVHPDFHQIAEVEFLPEALEAKADKPGEGYGYSQENFSLPEKVNVAKIPDHEVRIGKLEGLDLIADMANQKILVKDSEGALISELSVAWLNNEGTVFSYNGTTEKLELRNDANELLAEVPVSAFVSNLAKSINLTGSRFELKDTAGNVLDFVDFEISNINGLVNALAVKANKSESIRTVNTLTEAKALTDLADGEAIRILGRDAKNDGLIYDKEFYFFADDVTAENGGTVFTGIGGTLKAYLFNKVKLKWFGARNDGTDNGTLIQDVINLFEIIPTSILVDRGTTVTAPFTLHRNISIVGSGIENTIIKIANSSSGDFGISLGNAKDSTLEDFTLDGNKANNANILDGLKISTQEGESCYMLQARRLMIKNFSGNGVFADFPSFIFSIKDCRIRDNNGWGIYNLSTDNSFEFNQIALNAQGGIYNQGSNTRVVGGKILFNGFENENSGGVYDKSARSQFTGIECQENYYHGLVLDGSENCVYDFISDMNNVIRRVPGNIPHTQVPDSVAYGLKVINGSKNNIVKGQITSASKTPEKFTQFGKYIDESCNGNEFIIIQEPQFGEDTVLAGTKNRFNNYRSTQLVSLDDDLTIADASKYIVTSIITEDRNLILPLPNETVLDEITIALRGTVTNQFNFISNIPIGSVTATEDITRLPNNSIIVLENYNNGENGKWRVKSIFNDPYSKSEANNLFAKKIDAATKTELTNAEKKSITKTINSNYTILTNDFGKNGELNVIIDDLEADLTITLGLLSAVPNCRINFIRSDQTDHKVNVLGRLNNSIRDKINNEENPFAIERTYSKYPKVNTFIASSNTWYAKKYSERPIKIVNQSTPYTFVLGDEKVHILSTGTASSFVVPDGVFAASDLLQGTFKGAEVTVSSELDAELNPLISLEYPDTLMATYAQKGLFGIKFLTANSVTLGGHQKPVE